MKNKKLITLISIVMLAAIIISGITFSVWSWSSGRNADTNVSFTVLTDNLGYSCSADGGGTITEADVQLMPTSCTDSTHAIKRRIVTSVSNSTDIEEVKLDLWLNINNISQGLSNSQKFRYVFTTSENSCEDENVIARGTFAGKSSNDKITLIQDDIHLNGTSKTYYLYIWLDYNGIDRTTQGEQFNIELGGSCNTHEEEKEPIASPPNVYNTGLIPVRLSDSGDTVTATTEYDSNWYDYSEKKWANAVLVKETGVKTREYYKNNPGEEIDQSDILAYYVWIPRYSYQVWAYSGSDPAGDPHEIPIKFINTNVIDEATQIGDWYTHPAFWWDNDSDGVREAGEELSGIWVGKFKTSHTTLSGTNTPEGLESCTLNSCPNYTGLRILPNISALTYNCLARFFNAARHMEEYSLDTTKVDTHMMKNSEWGAVAYLSHSKYGINTEVRVNNQSGRITGCGAPTANPAGDSVCRNQYGTVTVYPQSTTGNVTGIFDMSGGGKEYVMGHVGSTTDYGSSGFSSLPDSKYYDNYSSTQFSGTTTSNFGLCTLATCGGYALNETYGWYSDNANFPTSWFRRGGCPTSNYSKCGAFSVDYSNGSADSDGTFRLILLLVDDES